MLYYLLKAEHPSVSVAFEIHEDVSLFDAKGRVILVEQVTSSQGSNPLANKALKPWKTLAGWVRGVNNGLYKAEDAAFVLYVLQEKKAGSYVQALHDASNQADAQAAIISARDFFWGTAPKYELKEKVADGLSEYLDEIFEADINKVANIIAKMQIVVGVSDPDKDINDAIDNYHYMPARALQFKTYCEGRLREKMIQLLAAGEAVSLTRAWFLGIIREFNLRYDSNSYIDFVLTEEEKPTDSQLALQITNAPMYINQLKIIEMDNSTLLRAAGDFLKAAVYRTKMSESGEYGEDAFRRYEEDLVDVWHSQKLVCENGTGTDEEFGRKLFGSCCATSVRFIGKDVPLYVGRGNFHSLANSQLKDLALGWHRNFKDILKKALSKEVL